MNRWTSHASYDALVAAALGETDMETSNRSSRLERGRWAGASWETAEKTALVGDMVGAEKLAPAIVEGASEMVLLASRFDPVYKVEGGRWVDVGRFCSGEPECFVEMEETKQGRKRGVAIVMNACVSGDMQPATFERIAVAIGETVLGLQAMGYAVAFHVAYKNDKVEPAMIDYFPLIGDGMQFDIAKLSAVLRTWFFRRIVFSLWETRDADTRAAFHIYTNGGYGHVGNMTTEEARKIVGDATSSIAIIDVNEYDRNPGKVKADILKAIKKGE